MASDFDTAIRTILELLDEIAKHAGTTVDILHTLPAYIGLVGVTCQPMAKRVTKALPINIVRIENNRMAAIDGALGSRNGAIFCCGTGSFVAGRINNRIHCLGGHGLSFGDEVAGAWLGRKLLAYVMHVGDGLRLCTGLTNQILQAFYGEYLKIIEFTIYATPKQFAEFAHRVFSAAGTNDAALFLVKSGFKNIETALQSIGRHADLPVYLVGGAGPHYSPYIPEIITNAIIEPEGTGLDGAMKLATKYAQEYATGEL